MTPFSEIYQTVPGILMLLVAMLLMLTQFSVLLRIAQDKRKKIQILSAAVHLLAGFLFFVLLMYGIDEQDHAWGAEAPLRYDFSRKLMSVPWLFFAAAEFLSAAVLYFRIRSIRRYRRDHPAPDAVKEALDHLAAAVCISDPQGTVYLSNLKMNELAQELTNRHLLEANALWERITAEGDPQEEGRLIRTKDGHAYLFTKKPLTVRENGQERQFERILASDMTDVYRITQDLSAKNKHLKEIQYHMKAVAAYERGLIAAREVIRARTVVHNQLGSVLLCGKHYLDHPDRVREDELLHLLEYNSFFQLVEAEQNSSAKSLHEAVRAAKRIGVDVVIEGTFPEQNPACSIFAQAVEQCAANTARHAEGDCLTVTLTETASQYTAEYRNNGRPPEKPVRETGGLLYLREAAEAAGGTVTIRSEPVFLLTVSVPKT